MSTLTSIEIQALVRNLDQSMRRHKKLKNENPHVWKEKLMEENSILVEQFPSIFDMHLDGKLDETFFYMLQMKHKMEKGEITEDQASLAVGQKLFNRFVAPVVEKQPVVKPLSYNEYYKQFSNGLD
jgi:hypothetical protein